MIKAVAYLRVSGNSQISGTGFTRQEQNIRSFATANDYEIVDIYKEEAISGTTEMEDRPAFTEMMQRLLKNGINTIIVESLDRLARQYTVSETLAVYIASKGINLISANTGENITEALNGDPMKKALIQIQGVFAELDKSQLVKKLRTGRKIQRKINKRNGIVTVNRAGKCEGRKSYAEKNPKLVKEAKRLYRKNPSTGQRRSLQQISKTLFASGYTTSTGKKFASNQITRLVNQKVK